MKNLLQKIVWPVMAAPLVYLAIVWNQLPEQVAMHYNLQGEPDRYGSKKELIGVAAILIAVNLFAYLLLTNIHRIDPKKNASDNRVRLQRIAFAVAVFISALLFVIIYSGTQSSLKLSVGFIYAGIGLLFAIIGNYMPNMKPNYFAGFRLPWTLENPDNWKRTHALAGKLWFAGGLMIAVLCLFTSPVVSRIIFFAIIATITIIPSLYSYRLYRNTKKLHSN